MSLNEPNQGKQIDCHKPRVPPSPSFVTASLAISRVESFLKETEAKVKIKEVHRLRYANDRARVGTFKRKARGRTYQSPRILLKPYFNKYVGKNLLILEGSATIENMTLGELPVLLLFIRPE